MTSGTHYSTYSVILKFCSCNVCSREQHSIGPSTVLTGM
uniref:Uncharacterized protein n=1 Tax=Anguilla anguilla TaxID=7936 RepID=A0A0E9WNX1_ANGAN